MIRTHKGTSHYKAGYGINGGEKVKYLRQDFAELLKAYGVELKCHPFDAPPDLFIVEKGKSYAETGQKLLGYKELGWK